MVVSEERWVNSQGAQDAQIYDRKGNKRKDARKPRTFQLSAISRLCRYQWRY